MGENDEVSDEQGGQEAEEQRSELNGPAPGAGGGGVEEALVDDEWDGRDAWSAWDEDDVKAYEQGWRQRRVVFTLRNHSSRESRALRPLNTAPVVNHAYRAAKHVWGRDQEESGLPLSRRLSVA